jgi:hypothetical protein
MKMSSYRQKKIDKQNAELARKANLLYKQGLTLRSVGFAIGRSHEWVRKVINS